MKPQRKWLEGFYPPDMDAAGGFEAWSGDWSMGPHADLGWVWFDGDDYTEEEARVVLHDKPWGIAGRNDL